MNRIAAVERNSGEKDEKKVKIFMQVLTQAKEKYIRDWQGNE